MDVVPSILLFVAGFSMILLSADWLVDNTRDLITQSQISPYVMGAIFLGIDVEEFVASVTAAIKGLPTVAVGNAIGNNTIALTLPLAVPILFFSFKVKSPPASFSITIIVLLSVHFLSLILTSTFPLLYPVIGVVTISLHVTLVGYNTFQVHQEIMALEPGEHDAWRLELVKRGDEDDLADSGGGMVGGRERSNQQTVSREADSKNTLRIKKIGFILVSGTMVIMGSILLGEGLENIVYVMGISQDIIGYIIIALGVNIEEFLIIYKSIKSRMPEIGMGGIIMKSSWNLGVTFGVSAILAPNIPVTPTFVLNLVLVASSLGCLMGLLPRKNICRGAGILLLLIFLLYMMLNAVQ